jgi:hypothetical protein
MTDRDGDLRPEGAHRGTCGDVDVLDRPHRPEPNGRRTPPRQGPPTSPIARYCDLWLRELQGSEPTQETLVFVLQMGGAELGLVNLAAPALADNGNRDAGRAMAVRLCRWLDAEICGLRADVKTTDVEAHLELVLAMARGELDLIRGHRAIMNGTEHLSETGPQVARELACAVGSLGEAICRWADAWVEDADLACIEEALAWTLRNLVRAMADVSNRPVRELAFDALARFSERAR